MARPKVIDDKAVRKLEDAFILGCTDREACKIAGVSKSTFDDYCTNNDDYRTKKESLKDSPTIKARIIINKELDEGNGNTAKWYLERKNKDEFSPRTDLLHGHDSDKPFPPIQVIWTTPEKK